ncbi:hypothetical protein [Dolichospermum sp. UHCC 0259]|uniref:hypothetical protein n=1 Tax=Dolichospermum sp. UHCC 0259 TaxID=2590010 RepID=UPI0014481A1D|nr:hypothetical protein [Dolichospermum sp. UHCC 0259]MTJ48390.1 hypothetical protein [Dolichospermum sp. UHCC 0259]
MTMTQKFVTDYGTLSVVNRKGYFYACRTVNTRKRQIYLGKCIPDSYTLNEIAKDIFSNDKEYWLKHTKQIRASDKDTNNSLSLKDDLNRIAALAKARGEDLICQELRNLIKNLS